MYCIYFSYRVFFDDGNSAVPVKYFCHSEELHAGEEFSKRLKMMLIIAHLLKMFQRILSLQIIYWILHSDLFAVATKSCSVPLKRDFDTSKLVSQDDKDGNFRQQ